MTHSLDDALVEKVGRAIYVAQRATLGLEPTPDAVLDEAVLDEVAALAGTQTVARAALEAAGVAKLREENERLREALVDLRKLAMDDHWGTPKVCWAIIESIDAALTNQGKAQG